MWSNLLSHPVPVVILVSCLVVIATPLRRRINCRVYVYHPNCRGISAKRSSSSSTSLSSPPSSSSSSSSASSSRQILQPMNADVVQNDFLSKLIQAATSQNVGDKLVNTENLDLSAPSSLSLPQQQKPHHLDRLRQVVMAAYGDNPVVQLAKQGRWKLEVLRDLLEQLNTKESETQETYGLFDGYDDDVST